MFENETTRILSAYLESKKLLKKLHALVEPYEYGKEKHDQIFYGIVPNVSSFNDLECRVHNALANILKNNSLNLYNLPLRFRKAEDLSIKERAKLINSVIPDDFYYNAFYPAVYNRIYYNEDRVTYSIKDYTYEEPRSYEGKMFLILNCVYLLDNPEPISSEIRYKISTVLKKGNTFILGRCKVSLYKNGRLIIRFASSELFERFQNKVNQAIKRLEKDLKRQEA